MKQFTISCLLLISFLLAQGAKTISAQEEKTPTLVSVHAEEAFLPGILSVLAKESGYNIVTDPNVNRQDKISIHLDEVPIEQAINLVVRSVGLSYEIVGNSFLIAEPKKLEKEVGITAHVIDLKYSDAMEVKTLLQDLTNQIQVDVSGNKLLVNASPKKIAEIEEVVKVIDVPAIQILLETRLIEVSLDQDEKLGVDWSRLAKYTTILAENASPPFAGAGSLVPGITQTEAGDGTVSEQFSPLPADQKPSQMYFQRLGASDGGPRFSRQMTALDITLDMLLKDNKADILADSKLVTLNGREATIKMVDIVPYILSSGGVGGQVQVQREEVGIKLTVLPTVNTDGDITVRVEPEVASIFEFIGPNRNIPRVKSRSSSTTIRVRDGETIILGGLISKDKKNTVYKFPLLHRIPWLGKKLFTSTDIVDRKTDLIIQITPSVVLDNISGIPKGKEMIEIENSIFFNGDEGQAKEENSKE
jgi:type II secretory pathway component GspD/PulD (secretin)